MAAKKPSIPAIRLASPDKDILGAVKETLEIITGQTVPKIKPLTLEATLEDVILKLNEVIARIQA